MSPLRGFVCVGWFVATKMSPLGGYFCGVLALMAKFLREPPVGAKCAKHRAKRSPECADPAKQGHALIFLIFPFKIPKKRGNAYGI